MLQIGGYIVLLAVWSYVRVHSLAASRQHPAAFLYGVLMLISLVVGSLLIAKVKVPSFNAPAEAVFKQLGRSLLKK
ncbi:hypothetical protein [Paenibacillus humicola]|uniref:hypothetical protein n=1 Tax=Paenibacillus humicola TaxID=3110540 RepID=UPI00237B6408|nr:hypothetical protein [Paenibacillus humicola]